MNIETEKTKLAFCMLLDEKLSLAYNDRKFAKINTIIEAKKLISKIFE